MKQLYFSKSLNNYNLKNYSILLLAFLMGVLILTAPHVAFGQSRGLSVTDYHNIESINIPNLDEDTYLKIDNTYILDRENKPFVFNFSDGIERKVYIYKVLDNSDRKEIALLLVYHLPASGESVNLCVPNINGDKGTWGLYIDKLKEQGEKTDGFLSCVSFALSRELSSQLALNTGETTSAASGSDDDYDFCFPQGSLVTLENLSQIPIELIKKGDRVLAYDKATFTSTVAIVEDVTTHTEPSINLTKVILIPLDEITATNSPKPNISFQELIATGSHPVVTKRGTIAVDDLKEGDILYQYQEAFNEFKEYKVAWVVKNYSQSPKVYNLITDKGNYIVNGIVVLDKMEH